jgi:hypothetical protein
MWIDKLASGVLRVRTPIGPRYIQPSLRQRIYLLWIFRHFHVLPQQVLSNWQQRLIYELCTEHRFVSFPYQNGGEDAPIIGTVERDPNLPQTWPAAIPDALVAEGTRGVQIISDLGQEF